MASERLEIRLDAARRKKLSEIAAKREESVSEVIRGLIDLAYEDAMLERRMEIVRQMSTANLEDVPNPEELSRQLEHTFALDDLH